MTPEKFGEMPRTSEKETKEFQHYAEEFFHELTTSPEDSEGARFFPSDSIIVDAQNRLVEIHEPVNKETGKVLSVGTEKFTERDRSEKEWLREMTSSYVAEENRVFSGEITPEKPFSPAFGQRICFTSVNIYETPEGQFISMPLLPKTEQRYDGLQKFSEHGKLAGANLLRGKTFPDIKKVVRPAAKRENLALNQTGHEREKMKLITNLERIPTGLWTIRFIPQKGKTTETRHCHVFRDNDTGTMEVMAISKQYVLDNFENFHPYIKTADYLRRVNTLVSLPELKQTPEGQPLNLKKLYFDNSEVSDLSTLPPEYQDMFEKDEDGIRLKKILHTPPLKGFLDLEKKIVEPTIDSLQEQIKDRLNHFFEKVVQELIGIPINDKMLTAQLPAREDFLKLISDEPSKFKEWAMTITGNQVVIKPDFLGPDGTFIEAKFNSNISQKPEKIDQLYRMVLYQLLTEQPRKIKYYTLEGTTGTDPVYPDITYQNINDVGEFSHKVKEGKLLKPFQMWRKDYHGQ
jgi:hypothetical protein